MKYGENILRRIADNTIYIKRATGFFIFLLLFLLLINISSGIVVPKKNNSKVIKSFYDEKKETVDVVFLGTSHSYRSILPMQLWADSGISAVNLGTSSQPMIATYYLMKEAIRTQKPKVFVLEMYACIHSDYKEQKLMSFQSAVNFIPLNSTKLSLWWEQLRHDFTLREQLEFLFPVIKYHIRWTELLSEDFFTDNYRKGGMPTVKLEAQIPGEYSYDMWDLNPVVEKYLIKMCDLCRKEKIPLIVYTAPIAEDERFKMVCEKINSGNHLCREKGVIVFDMQDVMKGMNIDFSSDFYNFGHLNVSGALKLTKWMQKELLQRFSLEDHRGDPRYKSWENNLPRYKENLESQLIEHGKQLTGELEFEETDGL